MNKNPSEREIEAYVKAGGAQCRFCGRWCRNRAKFIGHICVTRRACQTQYRDMCTASPSFKSRYPRWEQYDLAAETGTYVPDTPIIEGYLGAPPPVPADTVPDAGADNSPAEQPYHDTVQPAGVDTGFVPILTEPQEPVPTGMDVSVDNLPTVPGPDSKISKAITSLAGQAATVGMLAQKKISTKKEWGWRPILLALHELKMWVFAAKENNQYFKLHGDALKSGCYAYYNTFGDSPLTRITGKEFDETTMDALSWEITVYGDFYIQNAPQALGHTKTLLKGLKAWKDGGKKNVQTATGP